MNRFLLLLLTTLVLLSPSRLLAQAPMRRDKRSDVYVQPVVCNDGTISFSVARAYMSVWFGRQPWLIEGWNVVKPGDCERIGSNDNSEMHYSSDGMLGSGDDAVSLLAFQFRDSTGVLGAAKVPVGGAYEPSNQQFCVTNDAFRYTRNSVQSDLPRACDGAAAGYYLIPASVAFYGYSFGGGPPGSVDRDNLHVRLGPNDRAIPRGKHPLSSMTAQMIFGGEVHRDEGGQWHYQNGSAIPTELIVKKTGLPVLMPRRQYAIYQSPVQDHVKEIKDVMNSLHACTDTSFHTRYAPSEFDMDSRGVVIAANTEYLGSEPDTTSYGAALANLDLTRVTLESRGECYLIILKCKDGGQCIRVRDSVTVNWSLFVNTKEQGDRIVNALRAIAPYYPDGAGETH